MRRLTSVLRAAGALVILLVGLSGPAAAQDPYIGEIRWVAFTFAPQGWAECNGQIMSIAQNTALFSLLGTTYGGNGQTTFALPDMRGRFPMHVGQGPGLSNRDQGEVSGAEAHSLSVQEMPAHDHAIGTHAHNVPALSVGLQASSAAATSVDPAGNVLAAATVTGNGNPKVTKIYNSGPATVSLGVGGTTTPTLTDSAAGVVSPTGGTQPHSIMPPFLAVRCIIATQGIFPSRP
jgi:microcystin-dependent protein